MNDAELLAAARAGDADALESLLEHWQGRVYRYGLRMCGDAEDAKDVLQDTLLTAARNVKDFRGASALSTWLYTIARSFCIKKRRRSKFAPPRESSLESEVAPDAAPLVDPGRSPDEVVAGREIEQAIARAIASLDPGQREVLILRDVEGLTAPEVGAVLGIGVDAVKSRLHRARVAVRAAVGPLLGIPTAERRAGCPDIAAIFSRHLEDEIDADACAEMQAHLQGCAACRGVCDSLQRTLELCRASPTVPAPVRASVRAALQELIAQQV